MIRRIFLASASALALAGTALAADLPTHAPPPVFLPPPPMWTGFYIGVNAGYDWSASNSANVASAVAFNNAAVLSPTGLTYAPAAALGATRSVPVKSNGFIGGGQIGYNYQFATSWLVGIEADIQGLAGSNSSTGVLSVVPRASPPAPAGLTAATNLFVSKSIDYLGTVRGRFGYLLTPTLLIYGDGGLAYGGIKSATGIFSAEVPNTGTTNAFGVGRASTTRVGWTAGGGAEWMFLPNWSAKIEYAYYDLGNVTYRDGPLVANLGGPAGPVAFINTAATRVHFNGNVVRAGINYHFNWGGAPVVAKY